MSMDACFRATLVASLLFTTVSVQAATARSTNFVVTAATQEIADKCLKAANFWREELSQQWLNQELPDWTQPCPIRVNVGRISASGATTFSFGDGEVFGWNMEVNGTLEQVVDSVIPHEVNHTILASYFRRPLPRWADEGAATLVESDSERAIQARTLEDVTRNNRRIPLAQLLDIKNYPEDKMQVYALYAEGYALADFLVQQHPEMGRFVYLHFLQTAHEHGWEAAIRKHYSFKGVAELDQAWSQWIVAGSPRLLPEGEMLADATTPTDSFTVARGQTPELEPLPAVGRKLRMNREAIRETAALAPDVELIPVPTPISPEPSSADQSWIDFPKSRASR